MIINAPQAPQPIGPYSQAVQAGNTIYFSGQIPLDAATGQIVGQTIGEQTEQVMRNIGYILKEAGLDFQYVVKTTCLLTDMAHFAEFNAIYATYFPTTPPARSCFAVKALPMGVMVEVEVIAIK